MGEILLAHQKGFAGFEKFVVIKRLLPHLLDDASFVAMFITEARVAARLTHPNVCQVYDLGQVDNQYFISMEYLQGLPLSTILRDTVARRQLLDPRFVAGITVQACEGLHHAHELVGVDGKNLGLVHRDLTPSNLFVTVNGVVKILDFGIAKVQGAIAKTRTGTIKGKYSYMSPEQLAGEKLDRRSDLFTMGIVMFESLTCQRLFKRDAEYKTFRAITEDRIPRVDEIHSSIPAPVAGVVARALLRDRRMRYATARDLADPLREAVAPLGGPLSPTGIAAVLKEEYADALAEQEQLLRDARRSAGLDISGLDTAALGGARVRFPSGTQVPLPPPAEEPSHEEGKTTVYSPNARQESKSEAKRKPRSQAMVETLSIRALEERRTRMMQWAVFFGLACTLAIGGTLVFRWVKNQGWGQSESRFDQTVGEMRKNTAACLKQGDVISPDGLAVTFQISATGQVSRTSLTSESFSRTKAGQCVLDAVEKLDFGPQQNPRTWKFLLR